MAWQAKRPIVLELMCELTDEEVQHRAQMLGAAVVEQDEIDSRKRDAMKVFGEEQKEVAQRMRLLSRAIRSRKEKRLVGCVIEFHTPTQAVKRTTRTDTGEVVTEGGMTSEECQDHLFDAAVDEAFAAAQDSYGTAPELPLEEGAGDVPPEDAEGDHPEP